MEAFEGSQRAPAYIAKAESYAEAASKAEEADQRGVIPVVTKTRTRKP